MEHTQVQKEILEDINLSEEEKVNKLIEDKVLNGGEELTDPAAIAAGLYGLYYPKALQGIDSLSGNACKRVLKMLLSSHLEETVLKSKNKNESDLYQICDKLFESKYVLLIGTYMQSVQEAFPQDQQIKKVE